MAGLFAVEEFGELYAVWVFGYYDLFILKEKVGPIFFVLCFAFCRSMQMHGSLKLKGLTFILSLQRA